MTTHTRHGGTTYFMSHALARASLRSHARRRLAIPLATRRLWDKMTASPTPRHRVGCVDYESARGGCAYKIYYPTTAVPSRRPWSRPPNVETWLAYYGMTVFMFGVDAWPVPLRALVAVVCGAVWIVFRFVATLDAVERAPLAPGRFDVVVFSHGLAGFATCNAGAACALASRGFVVFAIQHRDGSASVSKSSDGRGGARWWTYASNGGVFEKRRAQAERRAREVATCAEVVDELHRGSATPNALPETSHLDVSTMFVGRLRTRDKTLVGFSFGGGTAVKVSAERRDGSFARIVLQDAWLEYMTDRDALRRACEIPTLSIKSERWGVNAKTSNERILKAPGPSGAPKPLIEVEIPGSRHHCFSDVAFFLGVAKKALGMIGDVDTRTFHAFNGELIAAFVRSGTDRALRRVASDFATDLPGVSIRRL